MLIRKMLHSTKSGGTLVYAVVHQIKFCITLEEASTRLSHICEIEDWTWDAEKRRSVEVDLCDTPRAYITEYVIPRDIYSQMNYFVNLLETLEEMLTPEQIQDYDKFPQSMILTKEVLVEDIRRAYHAFHSWHYRESGWAQEMMANAHRGKESEDVK